MAGAPEDGNPGREHGDEARQRAEARALAALLRGSVPRYPFPVEDIEEAPSEPQPPPVPEKATAPIPPGEPEPGTEGEPPRPSPARRRRAVGRLVWLAIAMLFIVLAAIAGLGVWELARSRVRAERLAGAVERARAELGAIRDDLRDLRGDVRALTEEVPPDVSSLVEEAEPSVVGVKIGGKVVASGFVVEAPALPRGDRTAIVTRAWVARAADRGPGVVVIHGRRSFRVRPGEVDRENGLALLFIEGALPSLPWETDEPRVGEFVAGVGRPDGQISATTGVVTASERQVVRTDASLTSGSGGGPVVNRRGEVVGVARAGRDGLVAAIPIDRACRKLLDC